MCLLFGHVVCVHAHTSDECSRKYRKEVSNPLWDLNSWMQGHALFHMCMQSQLYTDIRILLKGDQKQWQMPRTKFSNAPSIEPGDAGIWVTCDMHKEGLCTVELKDFFDKVSLHFNYMTATLLTSASQICSAQNHSTAILSKMMVRMWKRVTMPAMTLRQRSRRRCEAFKVQSKRRSLYPSS